MSKFFIKLPGEPGLNIFAPSKLAAISMAKRHWGWPPQRSVMGAKIIQVGGNLAGS